MAMLRVMSETMIQMSQQRDHGQAVPMSWAVASGTLMTRIHEQERPVGQCFHGLDPIHTDVPPGTNILMMMK